MSPEQVIARAVSHLHPSLPLKACNQDADYIKAALDAAGIVLVDRGSIQEAIDLIAHLQEQRARFKLERLLEARPTGEDHV
jgi:hypothetical protein